MLAPIDFSHVEQTLATPLGWADLGLVAVPRTFCLARRRRVWRAREASGDQGIASRQLRARRPAADRASRSCRSPPVRIIATSGRRSSGRSAPLLIALAAIRMIVYVTAATVPLAKLGADVRARDRVRHLGVS